jgi:methylated-DNA-protein-cysteine methyltransferase-like protein
MLPFAELWKVVGRIPYGHTASYGEVGKALHNPASGYMVGRWMANCPSDVPWWRVVAKDGRLPLAKRSPELAIEQEKRLIEEGVIIEDGHVSMAALVFFTDLLAEE